MNEMIFFFRSFDKTRVIRPLTGAYFLFALVEIIAEFNNDMVLIPATKPLLMPLLIALYWCSSKRLNALFVLSMLSVWFANLFFMSNAMNMIIIGSMFFMIYRLLVMYMVFRTSKFPGNLRMFIGCLPFLFLYLLIVNLAYKELGNEFCLFVLQGILMIVFGGFCLANYIVKSTKPNAFLLVSTLLFTATQFIMVIKIFYISYTIFQPIVALLFVVGQYSLYLYMLLEEKRRRRYRPVITK